MQNAHAKPSLDGVYIHTHGRVLTAHNITTLLDQFARLESSKRFPCLLLRACWKHRAQVDVRIIAPDHIRKISLFAFGHEWGGSNASMRAHTTRFCQVPAARVRNVALFN